MKELTVSDLPGKAIKEIVSNSFGAGLAVLIALCAFLVSCTPSKPVAEAPPPTPTVQADQQQEIAKLPPPELNQVQEAVRRVFKDSVVIDISHEPAFVAGDFNGDASQDIVVVLKPASETLADLNEEFPSWILRDLTESRSTGSPRLRVAANEVLLAVIHGYGSSGWRDPQATQTFLLKNAAGSNMATQSLKNVEAAIQGKKRPALRGDVVAENLGGRSGYLYYNHSTYAWYDPKSFTGEPEPPRGHGGPEQRSRK